MHLSRRFLSPHLDLCLPYQRRGFPRLRLFQRSRFPPKTVRLCRWLMSCPRRNPFRPRPVRCPRVPPSSRPHAQLRTYPQRCFLLILMNRRGWLCRPLPCARRRPDWPFPLCLQNHPARLRRRRPFPLRFQNHPARPPRHPFQRSPLGPFRQPPFSRHVRWCSFQLSLLPLVQPVPKCPLGCWPQNHCRCHKQPAHRKVTWPRISPSSWWAPYQIPFPQQWGAIVAFMSAIAGYPFGARVGCSEGACFFLSSQSRARHRVSSFSGPSMGVVHRVAGTSSFRVLDPCRLGLVPSCVAAVTISFGALATARWLNGNQATQGSEGVCRQKKTPAAANCSRRWLGVDSLTTTAERRSCRSWSAG